MFLILIPLAWLAVAALVAAACQAAARADRIAWGDATQTLAARQRRSLEPESPRHEMRRLARTPTASRSSSATAAERPRAIRPPARGPRERRA